MFYAGRDNEVYQKHARFRDWLYAIDDRVIKTIETSVFSLVDMSILTMWYIEGVSYNEAAMWTIVKGVI